MDEQDKLAVIQFLGSLHAQAKQTDQMIVGNSQYVKPISTDIRASLERALYTQQQAPQHYQPLPVAEPPQPQEPQPQEPQPAVAVVRESVNVSQTSIDSPELKEYFQEIILKMDKIISILENKNVKRKTRKSKQPG